MLSTFQPREIRPPSGASSSILRSARAMWEGDGGAPGQRSFLDWQGVLLAIGMGAAPSTNQRVCRCGTPCATHAWPFSPLSPPTTPAPYPKGFVPTPPFLRERDAVAYGSEIQAFESTVMEEGSLRRILKTNHVT